MKRRVAGVIGGALVLVVGAVVVGVKAGALNPGVVAGVCLVDDEINQPQRAALDARALSFVRAALGASPETAHTMMTDEAQSALSARILVEQLQVLNRTAGPYEDVHVAQTYVVTDSGAGSSPVRAVCGTLADDKWVAVAIKPGFAQAHVVVAARTKNNDWAFTLWLVPDGADWRVHNFHVGMSTIVGRTPEVLLSLARQEREAGHAFNAAIVLAAAQGISSRGPSFQLGVTQSVQDESRKLELPEELRGKPPFTWAMNGVPYIVAEAGMIGVAKEVGIVFALPRTSWTDEHDAEVQNRAFIDAFIAAHPDYVRVFSFLVARAMRPDNAGGFATVYENGTGFVSNCAASSSMRGRGPNTDRERCLPGY